MTRAEVIRHLTRTEWGGFLMEIAKKRRDSLSVKFVSAACQRLLEAWQRRPLGNSSRGECQAPSRGPKPEVTVLPAESFYGNLLAWEKIAYYLKSTISMACRSQSISQLRAQE